MKTTTRLSSSGSYQPAYQTVATKIAEFIASNDLKAGDRLPTELQLSQQLGVSRTVVREAIKVLVATGQVQARKGSGLYAADTPPTSTMASIDISLSVDPTQMNHLFEFRMLLETYAAERATGQITHREVCALEELVARNRESAEHIDLEAFDNTDHAFHMAIAQATRNPFLIASIDKVDHLQSWAINMILAGITPGSLRQAAEQHHALLVAITKGDQDAAAQAMRIHLQTVEECYEQEVRRRLNSSDLTSGSPFPTPTEKDRS